MFKSRRLWVLLLLLGCLALITVMVWQVQKRYGPQGEQARGKTASATPLVPAAQPPQNDALVPPSSSPGSATASQPAAGASISNSAEPSPSSLSFVGQVKLIVPVAGVSPNQLQDTFADSRSEGRVHDAIDIPAPLGTPVMAAADGEIVKLFWSDRGGTTIYQLSADQKLIYYYAHLQGYAAGLAEGKRVRQGEVIGFVGDSGNAGAGNYHLHFAIAITSDPKRYWEGTNINPYPILK